MNMKQLVELQLAGKTEEVAENLPHCHFTTNTASLEPGTQQWEARNCPSGIRLGCTIRR
jgi:hypothetical protein